jgi:hypothetical protein
LFFGGAEVVCLTIHSQVPRRRKTKNKQEVSGAVYKQATPTGFLREARTVA